MMEVATGFPRDILALVWHEKLSDDDVRCDMTPQERDSRAGKHDMRLLAKVVDPDRFNSEIATLEDLSQGVGQWRDYGRIAVVTDEPLFRHAVQFFGPFFHSPIRVFSNAQSLDARTWVRGGRARS